MKLTLTKEQREQLAPYERHLYTAYKAGYVVGLQRHITEGVLWPIYKDVFKNDPGLYSCNMCVMEVCKKLGTIYFENNEETTPDKAAEKTPEVKEAREDAKEPVSEPKTRQVVKSSTDGKKTRQKAKKEPKKTKK